MGFLPGLVLVLSLTGSTLSSVLHSRQNDQNVQSVAPDWPKKYIALGDSFAAGTGAGKYYDPSDAENKRCRRSTGSYPAQLKGMLPTVDNFRFVACNGDTLDKLTGQYVRLGQGVVGDVATLSISGNDFFFGDAVRKCVYNYGSKYTGSTDTTRDTECTEQLQKCEEEVKGTKVWDKYKTHRDRILSERLTQGDQRSFIVITGYAKFFDEAEDADACSKDRFPIPNVPSWIKGNLIHKTTRDKFNVLVDLVNSKIKSEIVEPKKEHVEFIDIDDHFHGHRFCEQAMDNRVPGSGKDNNDVWFSSLETELEESEFVFDPDSSEDQAWAEWRQGLVDNGEQFGPTGFGQDASFHPKTAAHKITAEKIRDLINARAIKHPPPKTCQDTGAGELPSLIKIPDLVSTDLREPNGLLAKLREQVCGNPAKCEIPSPIPKQAGAIVTDNGGRCEISIGVKGKGGQPSFEAYIVRDRTISDREQKDCWDRTWDMMGDCVKNGPRESWQNGVDPFPAFYQLGFVKLNSRTHDTIPEDHLLESFTSICDGGHGDCSKNDCGGNWGICSDGKYKGCGCESNTVHGSIPPIWENGEKDQPGTGTPQCSHDCCDGGQNQGEWYKQLWCPANCGGFSPVYCASQ